MSITSGINRGIQRTLSNDSVDRTRKDLSRANETTLEKSLKSSNDLSTLHERNVLSSLVSDFVEDAQTNPEKLTNALHQAFGDKASVDQINRLAARIVSGDVPLPKSLEFVSSGTLGNNVSGAYIAVSYTHLTLPTNREV